MITRHTKGFNQTNLCGLFFVLFGMPVNTISQSNLLILLQVSGKDHWFVLLNLVCMNTGSDRCFSPTPRGLEHVCLFANFGGRKKYQPLLQGRSKLSILSVKWGLITPSIKIDNQASINVKKCLFVPKLRLARAYFHTLSCLLAN